jgi:hypothetical protein
MARRIHHRSQLTTALGLVVAIGAAGCGASPSRGAATTPPSPPGQSPTTTGLTPRHTTSTTGTLPSTGYYADGSSDVPHYVLDVTSNAASSLTGSVIFYFQDGRTEEAFTFSGSATSGKAELTTEPGGKVVTATYTNSSISLAGCTQYLEYAQSTSACTFSYLSP